MNDRRDLLIVSPHFPPVNAPDMQRIRMSLPYYEEFGWRPTILSVDASDADVPLEPRLLETVPKGVEVIRVKPLPLGVTGALGMRNLALRALPALARAGRRLSTDLVYFSTSLFVSLPLGRVWKRSTGRPFVVDMQDPWTHPTARRRQNPKNRIMSAVHGALEPWTMREVDGLTAVTRPYIDDLQDRYEWLRDKPTLELPFGASPDDFELAGSTGESDEDGFFEGVYAGAVPPGMRGSVATILEALALGTEREPTLFERVRLRFVGTTYDHTAPAQIADLIERFELEDRVTEEPGRLPYFDFLDVIQGADFLLLPGSDDPAYRASKVFPYILARRPILGLFHERSSVCDDLRGFDVGSLTAYGDDGPGTAHVEELTAAWSTLLKRLPFRPSVDVSSFEPYTARAMTERQCRLFDEVLERTHAA